jgi:cell surface protein SprA
LGTNPKLLLHLGNVSEDILKDGQMQYENGLANTFSSVYNYGFKLGNTAKAATDSICISSEGADRTAQDLGYDGLSSDQEAALIWKYIYKSCYQCF